MATNLEIYGQVFTIVMLFMYFIFYTNTPRVQHKCLDTTAMICGFVLTVWCFLLLGYYCITTECNFS